MFKNSMLFVGLDLGDRHSHLVILDQDGELVEEARMPTTQASLTRRFSTLPASRVALEVGAHSRWVSALLTQLGHEVLVADAGMLRLIFSNPRKRDRADAEHLARLARLDPKLLSPIYHRSSQAQAHLAVIRARDSLVRARTQLINHARGLVKTTGARLPSCSAAASTPGPLRQSPRSCCPPSLPSWIPSPPSPSASRPTTGRSKRSPTPTTPKPASCAASRGSGPSPPWATS